MTLTAAAPSRTHAIPVVQDFEDGSGAVGDLPVYFEQIPHVDGGVGVGW